MIVARERMGGENLIGKIIKERYCILEQIGSGGNGSVYLAKDMELGCQWAVKRIDVAQKKEALILKNLKYPFLPRMIDYAEEDTQCFLVMEYIQGANLEEWLQTGQLITKKEVLEMATKIAKILLYFHEQTPPIFYGDLKPSNLIRTENGELYLVDFGSVVTGYRREGISCSGTKGYAAPEMYEGKIGTVSDVFAFGKTLGRLLKNRKGHMGTYLLLFWIKFWCCRKKEKFRYQNMKVVLQKLEGAQNLGKLQRKITCGILFLLIVFSVRMRIYLEKPKVFEESLKQVTELYWQEEKETFARETCEIAERKLKKMLREFPDNEKQRKILLLLAVNAEYMEAYENACFYYEQLLMYEENYKEGYAMYGLFLIRRNKWEEGVELYEKYQKKGAVLEGEESWNLSLWLEEMATYCSGLV